MIMIKIKLKEELYLEPQLHQILLLDLFKMLDFIKIYHLVKLIIN